MKFLIKSVILWFEILFAFKKKVVYFGGTNNLNLGDNAQRMLIARWCRDNFPNSIYIEIPIAMTSCSVVMIRRSIVLSVLSTILFLVLKLSQKRGDVFVTGSGYGFIDHASTWVAYARLAVNCKKTPILVMPQTINFYNLWMGRYASQAFAEHNKILMCCRDFISLNNAKKMFPNCRPIPMPDIVTSMIGTRRYANERSGVLFCIRNDFEAFYSRDDIVGLMNRFNCRVESRDTSISTSSEDMDANRERYIDEFLEYISSFRVVITDRYHGTIFSLVANTPVIVLNSNDHKLSSGVKWFLPEFSMHIQFADSLDSAYDTATDYLDRTDFDILPQYFKEKYWDNLKRKFDEAIIY